jgi:hypothetical protein
MFSKPRRYFSCHSERSEESLLRAFIGPAFKKRAVVPKKGGFP